MDSTSLVQWAFPAVVFICTALLVVGVFLLLGRNRVRGRLTQVMGNAPIPTSESNSGWLETIAKVAKPLAMLSTPEGGWEQSAVRRRFVQAGLRHPAAPGIFFGVKTLLAIGLPLLTWFLFGTFAPSVSLVRMYPVLAIMAVVGYYGCNFVLNSMIAARQLEIEETFPDALDLLTICVEAGLGLDAAIARVANEIRLGSEVVADELAMVSMDLRAGSSKERALRNLAIRTGVEDVESLVAVLIQAEKFGTTVGASLRIHSDMLRTKRMQRAEEKAAKIAVKLLFPLVFCIFPSMIVVLLGPSMIHIVTVLPKMINGN